MDNNSKPLEIVMRLQLSSCVAISTTLLSSLPAAAVTLIDSTNLDSLTLGEMIVGPVGPTVETTLANASGEGIGDLISSVSCPAGFAACTPPTNPAGTIYTYQHRVTPGVDLPNDAPFPSPGTILPLTNVREFRLNFPAAGFNGIAGYRFSDATTAGAEIDTELLDDGSLVWRLGENSGWDTGESITFFWQTTQPPSGPGGSYGIANDSQSGTAQGPLPIPVSLRM
ncbi:MAG: exosortase, PEP-CTERM interaction domain protein [Thermosynechococcaceae cyanobacterium]